MLIEKIDVIEFIRDDAAHCHHVSVCLYGEGQRVFTRCTIADAKLTGDMAFSSIVADHVVRQLRRMPEFRSGESDLQLSADLLPKIDAVA